MDETDRVRAQSTQNTDWAALEFKQKKPRSRWTFGCTGVGLLVLVGLWAIGQLPKLTGTTMSAENSAALRTVIEDARGAADDGIELASPPAGPIMPTNPDERAIALLRRVAEGTSRHRVTYHAALEKAELDLVLDPSALLADGGIERARARLDEAMLAFNEFASGIRMIVESAAAEAAGPEYPPGFQRQFRSSQFGPDLDRHLESERRVLRAFRGFVDTVGMGDISHDGEGWIASSHASSQALQRAIVEVERATTFQKSLLAQSEANVNDILEALTPK
jgi:hypothetical protein